jgi:Xaa-Pro aminopeptidase
VHTVGLNEYERPFFGPNSDEVLKPNMTVCIDVSMFGHPAFHGSRVEAGYVIREAGAEPLSATLEQLILSQRES